MIIIFDKSFFKYLKKLNLSHSMKQKLKSVIDEIEQAQSIKDIKNTKKIVNYNSYYRIRFNDYRIGVELLEENKLSFIAIAHRKEIYRIFP